MCENQIHFPVMMNIAITLEYRLNHQRYVPFSLYLYTVWKAIAMRSLKENKQTNKQQEELKKKFFLSSDKSDNKIEFDIYIYKEKK